MYTEEKLNLKQGHWILAKAGKKVLRPGGLELTKFMIDNLHIGPKDDVVEFAPGLGLTAAMACAQKPNSYTGVDINKEAAALVKKNLRHHNTKIVVADASHTNLPDACATKVYGEAMLSMHEEKEKRAIIKEAARILKKGGYYAIHELGLYPDDLHESYKKNIQKELSAVIRVSARPLTVTEWTTLLEEEGFKVVKSMTNPMHLLEKKRMIQDEGFFRTIKIAFNILKHKETRNRVMQMRHIFRKYDKQLNAVSLIAQKL